MAPTQAPTVPTRSAISNTNLIKFLGNGEDFIASEVPTLRAALRQGIQLQKNNLHNNITRSNCKIYDIASGIAPLILAQWQKSNNEFKYPVVKEEKNIIGDLIKYWNKAGEVARNKATKKVKEEILNKLDKLYDILNCKCTIHLCHNEEILCSGCDIGAHVICSCPQIHKIPKKDLQWVFYQRQKIGEMSSFQMAGNDTLESARQHKILKRKCEELHRNMKLQKISDNTVILEDSSESSSSSNNSSLGKPSCSTKNHTFKVTNTVAASIRLGVSNRGTSGVITGFLKDLVDAGYLTEEDKAFLTCDSTKIFRAKEKLMSCARLTEETRALNSDVECIFFYGRADKTKVLTFQEETKKYHKSVITEEHYTLIQEPEGMYVHHFSPANYSGPKIKPAKKIALGVFDWIESHGAKESIQVIGGDSTSTITGHRGGALYNLEVQLGHKCLWSICMIHTNELPLRRLIESYDGKTCSATAYKGDICQLLPKVNELPINFSFKALPGGEDLINLPEDIVKSLSTDQQNCYLLVKAIKTGNLSTDLANLKGGTINHSRWLTTAQALLMLWIREHKLQGETLRKFEIIVNFVIQSYFKLYFDIKVKNCLTDGPNHILTALKILRTQPKEVQDIIKDTISRGAYHAHSENLILSLLSSNVESERVFAIEKILQIRGPSNMGSELIRDRVTPSLNFEADSLTDLISWDDLHEPIITAKMSTETIKSFKNSPIKIQRFPIHTQSTERAVQHVSKACMMVYGQEKRDGFVKGMIAHRENFPVIGSKKTLV